MKKNILKIIIFFSIFVILLGVVSIFLMPKNNSEKYGMRDEKAKGILGEPENTIDVVVVGDSEAYTSIIPLKLWKDYGYTSYVCATPAQCLADSVEYTYDALKKQNSKIVILEADNIFREVYFTVPAEKILNRFLPIFRYHDRWKKLRANDLIPVVKYTHTDSLKGYKFTNSVKEADCSNYMNKSEKRTTIPEANKIYVKILKEYCDSKNAKLIILSTPSVKNWNFEKHNSVKDFAEEERIDFLDLNELKDSINIDWKTDSKDGGDHLNFYGAQKVTTYLGQYLNNMNILKDHRQDEKYQEWDKELDEYNKLTHEIV